MRIPAALIAVPVACVLILLSSPVCSAQDATPERTYTLDTLLRLDAYQTVERSFRVSPDSRRVAVAASDEGGSFVVINGVESPRYPYLATNSIAFSPDSRHVAYVAGNKSGMFLVVDGAAFSQYSSIHDEPPVFSPDSARLAFAVSAVGGEKVVEQRLSAQDGHAPADETRKVYGSIKAGSIRYSPDGGSLHFVGVAAGKQMMADGTTEGTAWDDIYGPVFGPDGRAAAYMGRAGSLWHVVAGGKTGKGYSFIRQDGLAVSADGVPVYAAKTTAMKIVFVQGDKEGPARDDIKAVAHSRDGKRFAYAAKEGAKWLVSVDGVDGPGYDGVGAYIVFSPDGKHCAYAAMKDGRWYAVTDTGELGPYMLISERTLSYSPDGTKLVFTAELGERQWAPVVDGRPLKPAQSMTDRPVFSPSGGHVASVGIVGQKQYVAVDGVNITDFDAIVVWNGGGIVFDGDSGLHYIAVQKRALLLVEETLE